jgi:pyridoxamine 5'-phosphate oxidase
MNLPDLRRDYDAGGLTEADAGDDPLTLFRRWLDEAIAAKLPEPNAMTLATVTAAGTPAARIVLLKAFDERGFTFFTNYDSRKGTELAANPHCALVFLWDELERQVRVEGTAAKTTEAESEAYFVTRPVGSKLGAWASEQSRVIASREVMEEQHRQLLAKYPDGNVPKPPNWGGYRVTPTAVEFWHGRPSRLHDRLRYTLVGGRWVRERLSP